MKIFILGSKGAMGNDLVRLLAERNNELVVTSKYNMDSQKNRLEKKTGKTNGI